MRQEQHPAHSMHACICPCLYRSSINAPGAPASLGHLLGCWNVDCCTSFFFSNVRKCHFNFMFANSAQPHNPKTGMMHSCIIWQTIKIIQVSFSVAGQRGSCCDRSNRQAGSRPEWKPQAVREGNPLSRRLLHPASENSRFW